VNLAARSASLSPLARVEQLMHHLIGEGFLAAIALEHLESGGRRLRARLALAAGEAFEIEDITGWAAACELLHNATLVHDDLQDGDTARRGYSTVWATHGTAQAINTGDLLLMLPFLAVGHQPATGAQRNKLSRVLAERASLCVRGQAEELVMSSTDDWSRRTWTRSAHAKSGQLLALPIHGAGILAGRADSQDLGEHFAQAGVLYQLVDDVVDLYGNKGRDRPGCDLREGKVSALIVRHLELQPKDRDWLRSLLALDREDTPSGEIERAALRFRQSGAFDAVLSDIAQRQRELLNPALPSALLDVARALAERCTADLETLS